MRIALLLVLLLASGCTRRQDDGSVVVFAAASLAAPLEAIRDSFAAANAGVTIHLNTASSATLARQIEAGAPFDVFFSADPAWVEYLQAGGFTDAGVWQGIGNRLAVVRSPHAAITSLQEARRIATGDPSSVPLGRYAQQALTCEGVWSDLEGRIVGMVDAGSATEAVRTGAADAGILYETDARRPGLVYLREIHGACGPDIRYAGAVARAARAEALHFFRYARAATEVWRAHHFTRFDDG